MEQERKAKMKAAFDERVARAQTERGQLLVITGNGKGKTTSGFGTIIRALGHDQQCFVAQFIKGKWEGGERELLSRLSVPMAVMETGFTWESENKEEDIQAAKQVWQICKKKLADPDMDLILLDEITYMITYKYLELQEILEALKNRPPEQSVIITGRGCHRAIKELADTVSEVRNVKHAFKQGIKARKGLDY